MRKSRSFRCLPPAMGAVVPATLATLFSVVACVSDDPTPPGVGGPGGSGGSGSGGRAGSEGRGGSSGGTGGTSVGTGGSGTGGSAGGSGGATGGGPTGGTGTGGSGAGGGGGASGGAGGLARADGGSSEAGALNDGGAGEAGGPGVGARPSEGCGKANPPRGARMFMTAGANQPIIVSLPASYDANTPYALGFAFHGFGRTHANCQTDDCPGFQSSMGDKAVLVYMKSITAGWEQAAVRQRNLQYFIEVVAMMKKEYCVDESRVFAAGTSSGAAFANIVGCKAGDLLRVVSPVAGPADNTACKGNPAALIIHGIDDNVGAGENARNLYAQRNGCSTTTVPPLAELRTKIRAARTARRGEMACASYEGCTKNPVRWCEHSFGGYDNSTHGWPPPGGAEIWQFVQAQK